MNSEKTIEISVLMPVYNGEKFLVEAIDSILNQTFRDFEFIIVNDGSTDRTVEIIESYNDQRIKLINRENGGVSAALNTGLENAKGKYIVRMDADDISHLDRIEKQYDFIKNNPEYIIVGTDVNYITEENDFVFRYFSPAYSNDDISAIASTQCPFIHTSVIFVKNAILKAGCYEETAYAFEDHFLWANLAKKQFGLMHVLKDALVDVRLNPGSVTVDFNDYDPEYLKTKFSVLSAGVIDEDAAKVLKDSFKKLDKELRELSYHRLLAKKYLWSNYNLKKARENLKKAHQIAPFQKKTMILYLVSFLPKRVISFIYNLKKK